MNAPQNDNKRKAMFHPAVPFPLVKLFPHYLLAVFALLNAASFFVGYRIRVLNYHAFNFARYDSRINLFRSMVRGFDVVNQTPYVEFVRCHEHLFASECATSHFLIDRYDEAGSNSFNETKRAVSLNKVATGHSNVYFEAMVHPALLIHDNPRRIVVMNDVSGGILREVLKHSAVQEVLFILPNAQIVSLAREYLSEWNDCSSFVSNYSSCYDDPRVQIQYIDDPIIWFHHAVADRVDVVFADATIYPSVADRIVLSSIYRVLGTCGILALHAANIETTVYLPVSTRNTVELANEWVWSILDFLHDIGFSNLVDYVEEQRKFLLIMKCSQTRSKWLWNEAEWNVQLHERVVSTSFPLSFIDGASILQYQFALRTVEESWCQKYPVTRMNTSSCLTGHGFDPEILDVPLSYFVVQESKSENGGRGLFTTQDIASGSTIALGACVEGIHVSSSTFQHIVGGYDAMKQAHISDFWEVTYLGFIEGYGWISQDYGGLSTAAIDSDHRLFANHGCNGTYNVDPTFELNELNLSMDTESSSQQNFYEKTFGAIGEYSSRLDVFYQPYNERHYPMWWCQEARANRNIDAGEEVLFNYFTYAGMNDSDWTETIQDLKFWCSGGVGFISHYDMEKEGSCKSSTE